MASDTVNLIIFLSFYRAALISFWREKGRNYSCSLGWRNKFSIFIPRKNTTKKARRKRMVSGQCRRKNNKFGKFLKDAFAEAKSDDKNKKVSNHCQKNQYWATSESRRWVEFRGKAKWSQNLKPRQLPFSIFETREMCLQSLVVAQVHPLKGETLNDKMVAMDDF